MIRVRNLVPLFIASLFGFFLALLAAMDRLPYHSTLRLGELGLAIALAVAFAMAIGVRGRLPERIFVALLRAGLSGGVFVFMFDGVRLLAKLGAVTSAVGSWAFAALLAFLLARLVPAGAAPAKPVSEG